MPIGLAQRNPPGIFSYFAFIMINKPFIVGITGGSASGKTSFLKGVLNAFSDDQICLISQDNYYRTLDEILKDDQGIHNFDLPETIDHHLYAQHIEQLRMGQTVYQKEYVFNNANVVPRMLTFRPAPIIVVEGIFVFHFRELADQMDLKIFIDAKNSIKLERRVKRDAEERGYDLDDVMYRWKYHVKPTYKQFIKPYRAEADIVIPNNVHYQKGLDVVIEFLKTKVS
jgi:uridine kinase